MNGRTLLTNGTTSVDGSLYHDYGFIDLEPCDIVAPAGNYITTSNILIDADGKAIDPKVIGCHVFVDGRWLQIVGQHPDADYAVWLSDEVNPDYDVNTPIVTMNHIIVTPDTSMELTKLNFVYQPTFA